MLHTYGLMGARSAVLARENSIVTITSRCWGSPPDALLDPLLANVRAGLASVADALSDDKLTIDASGSLHLPALEAFDGEVIPKRTGRAIFETIGEQQLPDILLELDANTGFSEALLGHKAATSDELLACYAGLLAHGTEIDAKGIAAAHGAESSCRVATGTTISVDEEPRGCPRKSEQLSRPGSASSCAP